MYPFVLTLHQDAENKSGSSPLVCCVNVCLHSRVAKVASCPWVHFYVGTIVGILFLIFSFSFSTSGVNGGARVSSEVDFIGGISTVSPVRRGALQLHQVISPCERCCWLSCIPTTQGHLVQDGPREKMHGNTVQLFQVIIPQSKKKSSTTCKLLMHAIYMHSFQYSKGKEFSIMYKIATSSIMSCKSREFIDIHLSKQTKINLYYKYGFYALILLTLLILILLHGLRILILLHGLRKI